MEKGNSSCWDVLIQLIKHNTNIHFAVPTPEQIFLMYVIGLPQTWRIKSHFSYQQATEDVADSSLFSAQHPEWGQEVPPCLPFWLVCLIDVHTWDSFFGGHSVLMDVIDLSTAVVRECSRSSGLGELATWRCWKARRRAGGGPASTSEWCTASAFGCCPCEQSGLGRKKKAFKAFVYYRVLSGRALYLKSFWNEEKYPPKIVPSLFTTDFLQSLWLVICSLNSIFDHSSQNLNFFWTQEI